MLPRSSSGTGDDLTASDVVDREGPAPEGKGRQSGSGPMVDPPLVGEHGSLKRVRERGRGLMR